MIDSLLNDLVGSVPGATGAIVVAVDGEAVQFGTSTLSERLRLRGAYAAVVMQTFRAAAGRGGLGELKHLVVEYAGSTLVAHRIDKDCSLVLELKPTANVGHAVYRVEKIAAELLQEITA